MTVTGGERRFFEELAALFGSRLRETRRLGPQVVYFALADGREFVHKEVPRQERPAWRPGRPWAELVWVDYLASEGLPVPRLEAADLDHGWLVLRFVAGRLLGEGAGGPAFERLLDTLLRVERAAAAAPDDVRAFLSHGAEADFRAEGRRIARWLGPAAREALDSMIAEAFGDAVPVPGPLDVRAENAIDAGGDVVLIDFAAMGADYTERRLAGYMWTALPSPRSALAKEHYRAALHRLGQKAALRLAFFDFAHCARALERCGGAGASKSGALDAGSASSRSDAGKAILERLFEEWRRSRIRDPRVEALRFGLLFRGSGDSSPG